MYYAVHTVGVYNTWDDAQRILREYKNAKYKKFKKLDDAVYFQKFGTAREHSVCDGEIHIWTDGSFIRNKMKAGVGIVIKENGLPTREVSEPFVLEPITNNRAEIMAVVRALEIVRPVAGQKLFIHTDSMYVINGITAYIHGWLKNNWMTKAGDAVKNKDLWVLLYDRVRSRAVTFEHVKGHANSPENSLADTLANAGAM